jgi:endonuclease G, mitochondrial
MRHLSHHLRLPLAIATVMIGIVAIAAPSSSAPPIESSNHLEFGNPGGNCTLLDKRVFVVGYDEEQKIPLWVAYRLRRTDLTGAVDRTDDFRADEELDDDVRSELRDYAASGYDRGHMAPAEVLWTTRPGISSGHASERLASAVMSAPRRAF